jgi:PadR family transcriptional regulator, regulatory protein PadR
VDQRKMGCSENNRKARFYSLTPKGRGQLVEKTSEWERLTKAMGLILSNKVDPGVEEA